MSFRATVLRRSFFVVSLLGLIAGEKAFGQAANSPIAFDNEGAITTSFVSAPNMGGGSASNGEIQWLKVEWHYGTTSNLTTPFLDEVTFKVWIEGRDLQAKDAPDPTQGIAIGLTGTVTYVNVPAGKDLYGVVYVNPNTLTRYSTAAGPTDFDRKFDVHVSAYIGGAEMDRFDKNKETDPNWYKQLRVVPNLVYRQNQCPFIVVDPDRYPAIKLQPDAGQ